MKIRAAIILIFISFSLKSIADDSTTIKNNIVKLNLTSLLLPLHTVELSYERLLGEDFGIEAGGGFIPVQQNRVINNVPLTSKGYLFFVSPKVYFNKTGNSRIYIAPMFTYHHIIRNGFIYGMGGSSYYNADYYQVPDVEYQVYEYALVTGIRGRKKVNLDFFLGLGVTSVRETVHVTKAYFRQPVFSPSEEPLIKLNTLQRFPFKLGLRLGYNF